MPDKIVFNLPNRLPVGFVDALRIRLVSTTTTSWEQGIAVARDFFGEHGHLTPPNHHLVGNFPFYRWLSKQRRKRKLGWLSDDKIASLDALGMTWSPRDDAWEYGLAAAERFFNRERNLLVSADHIEGTFPLGSWIVTRRAEFSGSRSSSSLTSGRRAALDALGMTWSPRDSQRDTALQYCHAYHDEFGNLEISQYASYRGFKLGS